MDEDLRDTFGVEKLTTLSKLRTLWAPHGVFLVMIRPFRGSGLKKGLGRGRWYSQ